MAKNAMLFLEGRLYFTQALWKAKPFAEGDEPRFDATLAVPHDSPEDKQLQSTVAALIQAAGWKKLPPDKIAVKDGDDTEYETHQGMTYVKASNTMRPVIVDANKAPLVESDGRPYAGCYVMMKLELWVQDNSYGKRINAKLHGVQFLRDGDPVGAGGPPNADGFEDRTEDPPF